MIYCEQKENTVEFHDLNDYKLTESQLEIAKQLMKSEWYGTFEQFLKCVKGLDK